MSKRDNTKQPNKEQPDTYFPPGYVIPLAAFSRQSGQVICRICGDVLGETSGSNNVYIVCAECAK